MYYTPDFLLICICQTFKLFFVFLRQYDKEIYLCFFADIFAGYRSFCPGKS
jgi:hypothetical protein